MIRLIVYVLILGFILGKNTLKPGASVLRCVIVQEKETISVPFQIPAFLLNASKAQCQIHLEGKDMLRCGKTNVFVKPECFCSFYNVFEAKYHGHSSCPEGDTSDIVTQLHCEVCRKYSSYKNGPCINGGKLTCIGEEYAPEVTCQCPPNYEGRLCENRIENVTRICDIISKSSARDLPNCDITSRGCVTYSRDKTYAYRCRETYITQQRLGLPLCRETKNIAQNLTEVISVDTSKTELGNFPSKAGSIQFSDVFAVALFAMFFEHFI